jgi:hypothetical protein
MDDVFVRLTPTSWQNGVGSPHDDGAAPRDGPVVVDPMVAVDQASGSASRARTTASARAAAPPSAAARRYTRANDSDAPARQARDGGRGSDMTDLAIGQTVQVTLPKGQNKRGVVGVNVMYQTWMEARFEGAVGEIVDIEPIGEKSMPTFLVDFRKHDNSRLGIPWQAQWFREEWLAPVEAKVAR